MDLDCHQRHALAAALGDEPETVISVHLLRRGLCRAVIAGSLEQPTAALIQAHALPEEPTAFGNDPDLVWTLLRHLDGWACVNVSRSLGEVLAGLIERKTGRHCLLREERYHVLEALAPAIHHAAVRLLTADDCALLQASTPELAAPRDWGFGGASILLRDGLAAGAVIDDQLVAVAFTSARTPRHADISVATTPARRRRGLATAAAAVVCGLAQAQEQTPVWSVADDNHASLRVAQKIGFTEIQCQRVYVIPES